MRNIILIIILLIQSYSVISQTVPDSLESFSNKVTRTYCDSCINYINKDSAKSRGKDYVIEIENKVYNKILLKSLDKKTIKDVDLVKGTKIFNGKSYEAELKINFKENYKPRLISIIEFVKLYIKDKEGKYIVSIDDEIVNEDFNECFLDKNYISTVYSETIGYLNGIDRMTFVTILTKGSEKLQKPIKVMIK